MSGPVVPCIVECLRRDMATTTMVLTAPPTTTKDRLKRKPAKLWLATIKGTEALLYRYITVEGSKIQVSPHFAFRPIPRWYLETKRLKREAELLVIDDEDFVGISSRVQVIPSKKPIRKFRSSRLMKPRNVFSNCVNHGDRVNGLQSRVDVLSVRLGMRQVAANIVEEGKQIESSVLESERLAEQLGGPLLDFRYDFAFPQRIEDFFLRLRCVQVGAHLIVQECFKSGDPKIERGRQVMGLLHSSLGFLGSGGLTKQRGEVLPSRIRGPRAHTMELNLFTMFPAQGNLHSRRTLHNRHSSRNGRMNRRYEVQNCL